MDRNKDAVYRQMVRLCGNREDAEDALVEALINAYRASSQLADDHAFRAWLAAIARRACYRLKKKDSLTQLLPINEDLATVSAERNEAESDQLALKDCIHRAIERLPEKYRTIYLLCELEDMDVKEAAKRLGLNLAAAKSRLLRARERARKEFDRSFCAGP